MKLLCEVLIPREVRWARVVEEVTRYDHSVNRTYSVVQLRLEKWGIDCGVLRSEVEIAEVQNSSKAIS
ncbi:hypothetical protein BE15_09585 [Sorangium cellulosum]|uniref:Uncharacterized protein n=1 Tax=Sorangium cellulosum TaxID=56 RepID=A0A150QM11_SORCE|nr:hypothetical protein BE15_09585 [Sorangium cellulosum]